MDRVRRPDTGIPDVEFRGGVMRFGAERYSDNAAVLAADKQHLVQQLVEQDEAAPRFRVRHVPSKEEYLFVDFTDPTKPRTRGMQEDEYKTAKRRTLNQGLWILGNQVLRHTSGVYLRAKLRGR